MIFPKNRPLIYLFFIFNFFILKNSFALESLSYSGRLVNANGSPVVGQVTIRGKLAYTNNLSSINTFCTQDLSNVDLTNGVFHVKFDFVCKIDGNTVALTQFLSQTPAGESVAIQITDMTNSKSYSHQALHSLPYANVASQLVQMGAANNQVLMWNSGEMKWKPETLAGSSGGTVTNVTVSAPLSVATSTSTPSITLPQATGAQSGYLSSADWTTFNNKEGTLAGGTTAQYYRGDKSWQTLDSSVVPENGNLYFTNARALGIPLTGFSATSSAIVATDTVVQGFSKAQGQINTLTSDATHFLKKDSADTLSSNVTLSGSISSTLTGDIIVATTPLGLTSAVNKGYVDSGDALKVSKAGDTLSGVLTLDNDLKIKGGSNYVTVKGHASSAAYNLFLPQTAGTAGYFLSTDGNGNTSWVSPSVNSSSIVDGSIVDADINASAAIAQSKIAGLTTDLSNKQPLITAGTNAQYFRGDKTFVDFGTDVRGTALTGFSTGANSTVLATDTALGAFQKVQGQIDATNTAVSGKEPSLTAGSASQYYRGDKTWQTLNGATVANTAAGTIAATNVQAALNELDSEKQANITSASAITSGSVTTSLQNGVNVNPFGAAAGNTGELRFYELSASGSNYTSLKAPDTLAADINYVLPSAAPTAGQVLSSNASGVMSWITLPTAPVSTVFGRSGTVSATAGDYTASQITNTPAGTIAAVNVQTALNELDTEKEPILANPNDTTKYYRGDKTWSTFATDAINSTLSTLSLNAGAKPSVANTDTVVGAFGKVQKYLNDVNADYVSKSADNTVTGSFNISGITSFIQVPTPSGAVVNEAANVQYVQNYVGGFGQWSKAGSDIYRNGGNVGIGTTAPMASSLLELNSTTKGFSPPRMTLAQRNAIASPTQGLMVFNTTDNTVDYYNGSAWLALNGSPKYIKLVMSAYQSVDTGSIVAFDSVQTTSGMSRSGNGIQLKAGVTYRLEASINTYQATGASYLGYALFNGTTTFGHGAYTDESENVTYGFKSSILEIYKPSVDEVVSLKINDDNIGTGQITPNYNTYLMATELVPSGPAGGGSDNLGNHTLSQNLILGSNWLSGDGGAEGIRVDANGNVGVGTSSPNARLDVASSHNISATGLLSSTFSAYIEPTISSSSTGSSIAIKANGTGGTSSVGVLSQKPAASDWRGLTTITYMSDAVSVDQGFSINQFHPNNAQTYERFRIDSNGNVGIGTASPTVPLEVVGNVKISGQIVNDPWTNVSAFSNSWAAYYPIAGSAAPGYRKYKDGRVALRGCMTPGSWSSAAFTLPAGYAPTTKAAIPIAAYYLTAANSVSAYMWVHPDGTVNPWLGNNATWICLDGVSFPTD